jgi:hypothetical protein
MPVGEMLDRMDSRELTEWQAYFAYKAKRSQPPPQTAAEKLRETFGHRVKRKTKEN